MQLLRCGKLPDNIGGMDAKLIVVNGKTRKRSVALKLPTVVGRSRKVDLTVAHPMVSRRHCELFEADGLLMIRDLDSMNGTIIGDRRVKEAPLPPDGEFSIGPITFRAQYEYQGDLDSLPEAVPAEPRSEPADAPAAEDDKPSNEKQSGKSADKRDGQTVCIDQPTEASPQEKVAAAPDDEEFDIDSFLGGDDD